MNTGQNFSNLTINVGVTVHQMISALVTSLADRAEGDRGQGVLEYAGVLMVVAALIIGIMKLKIDELIEPLINAAIDDVETA